VIPPLKNVSISLFAGSGILAIIIGFAAQQSFANIVSGIFITLFKPFRIGDRVKLLGKEITGVVEDITLRHTVIRTFENKRIIVPNSVISTEVVENSNLIDAKICKFVEIGISYGSDLDRAKAIMCEEAMRHPETIDNRNEEQRRNQDPVVPVRVVGFGESAVLLRAWVWAKDQPTAFQLGCDLYERLKMRFDQAGIEIPFPHRKIIYTGKAVRAAEGVSASGDAAA
jgi:small conductance mechanosensitive channel